jgi:hypothetical protein
MKNQLYNRIATVATSLIIIVAFLCFIIFQFRPEALKPSNGVSSKKKISFLITSPILESYLRESVGQEAKIIARSRETARVQIREFSQTGNQINGYLSSGILTCDAEIFEQEDSLYLGLTPAKIGQDVILETGALSAKAILLSIKG